MALPTAGPATSSNLNHPDEVAVDGSGNVYIADTNNNLVEKVTPGGTLSIIAGSPDTTVRRPPGRRPAATCGLPARSRSTAAGTCTSPTRNNQVVEKVTPGGTLSIIAGTGTSGAPTPGPATSSDLSTPLGVTVDGSGNVYIADTYNNEVEEVTSGGTLSIIAGTGTSGAPTAGPATSSDLSSPSGVAVDSSGNVYIADRANQRVEEITGGNLAFLAGTGQSGGPTAGPATSSELYDPSGVAVDSSGDVYIADGPVGVVAEVASNTLVGPRGTG